MGGSPIHKSIHLSVSNETRFVALGDGGSGLPGQKLIADRMIELHDQVGYSVVLLLGDNIYPNGDTIKYGKNRFTSLYKPLLDRGVKFMAVLGNHDIAGPLGVGFPKLWLSNQRENMKFFKMPWSYYDFTMGSFHFFMINTNNFKRVQREWLNDRMEYSDKPWKIVCGHHPVYSSGFHGSSMYLKAKLKPILEQHNANLYLSAHEHDYERLAIINEVTYVISGGGGADLRGFSGRPLPGSLLRKSEHHFLSCVLRHDFLCIDAINASGNVIDSFKIHSADTYEQQIYQANERMALKNPAV